MFDRKTTRIALILLSLLALSGNPVLAQNGTTEAARIWEAQRQAEERRKAQEIRMERDRRLKALNESKIGAAPAHVDYLDSIAKGGYIRGELARLLQLDRFRSAYKAFESAREELGVALDRKAKLKDPARRVQKSAEVFLDSIKTTKASPRFDPAEFKDFTPTQLGWEALNSAGRLSPHLAAVIQTEEENTVDLPFLLSLSKLREELLRLQWMTQRLK